MSAQEPIVWLNGKLVIASEARISPFDRGFTVGCAAFETLKAQGGKLLAATRHWRRLVGSCRILGIHPPLLDEFVLSMTQTLHANHLDNARVRYTVSAGDAQAIPLSLGAGQTFLVHAVPSQNYAARESVITVPWPRNECSAITGAKCASYAENIIALDYAHKRGFGEAIFANTRGELCEGATTNVFMVQDDEVLTPPTSSGCLPGITREIVLDICRLNRIPVRETKVPVALLESADECFLTSSTRGVQPIAKVNAHSLSKKSNSLTQQIINFYQTLLMEDNDP